jgi:predicted transcriptional regulator
VQKKLNKYRRHSVIFLITSKLACNGTFNFRMLALAREARGLSQSELANNSKTDQGYLSKIEKGLLKRPSKEILEKYALALNFQ